MGPIGLDVSILEEPRWTGVERSSAGLVRALGEAAGGGEVLLYSRRPVAWPFPLGPGVVPRVLGGPATLAIWRETRLPRALRRDGAAVLHSPVAAIPLLTRTPRIATVHELPWLRNPGIEGRARESVHRARIRAAVRAAARVIVPSETVARDLTTLCPRVEGRVVVLRFGVEPMFRPLPAGDWGDDLRRRMRIPAGPLLLFVGKARRRKNLPGLLRAFAEVRTEIRPVPTLILAGVDAEEVPRSEGVVPTGFVSDRDLVGLYNLATTLAYPSISEGFGFPPLEAMACGTAVIASSAGAVPEVLSDAALLVDPASPDALAAAILRALSEPDLRADLSRRGRERVLRFRWCDAAEKVLSVAAAVAA